MERIVVGSKYIAFWFFVSIGIAIFLGFAFGLYLLLNREIKVTGSKVIYRSQTIWAAPLFILSAILFWLPAFWPASFFDYLSDVVRVTYPLSLILFVLGVILVVYFSFWCTTEISKGVVNPWYRGISLFWGIIILLLSFMALIFFAYWILAS